MSREKGAWLCIFSHKRVTVALKCLRSANAKYHFIFTFSLACLSNETHNLQRVLLRIYDTKGDSLCQAFRAETVETGNKNRCVIEATHVFAKIA